MADNTPAPGAPDPTPAVKAAPAPRRRANPANTEESRVDAFRRLTRDDEEFVRDLMEAGWTPPAGTRPAPAAPSFGISEGERVDLAERGVTTSPFTGERLIAPDHDVEPANPTAERNVARELRARAERERNGG